MDNLPKSIRTAPGEDSHEQAEGLFFPLRPQQDRRGKTRISSKLRSIQLIITVSFTAITVLVAVIVSFMLYNKFAKTAEENANLNMQQIIEQVNYNLELYVKGMSNIFETAEEQVTTSASIDSPLLYERMDTLMNSREDLVSVAVFTLQGKYVVGTPGQNMRLNTQLESQSWFTTAKKARRFPIPHRISKIYSRGAIPGLSPSAK